MAMNGYYRILASVFAALLLVACGDNDNPSRTTVAATQPAGPTATASPSATQTPPANATPGPSASPQPSATATAKTIYNVANACFTLSANDVHIGRVDDDYGVVSDANQAAKFFLKPSALGQYLLLSDYQRAAGEFGTKQLLGVTDPAGEFLDELGNFVGEVGFLLRGVLDMADYLIDPALAGVRPLHVIPEEIIGVGGMIGDNDVSPGLGTSSRANDLALWNLQDTETSERFLLQNHITGMYLHVSDGLMALSSDPVAATEFALKDASDCVEYPEVSLGAQIAENGPARFLNEVERFAGMGFDEDDIFGFVDTHAHISAYEFIGGRINYGDPFHKFGIDHALEDCEVNHGPQGVAGFVEMVTTDPTPHATRGWPDFPYWPVNNSLQHHQSYYRWIERAFVAGQKILVNHLVHNEILCQLNPQKQNDCDAMPAIEQQAHLMHEMQDYIDAQHGGPGEGWFRIVTSPVEARSVIADGKMAVILGVEMSKPMNCGEFLGVAECSWDEIIERLDTLADLGVRSLFPVHKFDNAFGGHLLDLGNPVGIAGVLYLGNFGETGHPIEYETCPNDEYSGTEDDQEPSLDPLGIIDQALFNLDYLGQAFPASPEEFQEYDPRRGTEHLCNTRGLTGLGEDLIKELMRRGWLIETDHISRKAAARILEMTAPYEYPVVNSHGGWGGTNALRDRIVLQGGLANNFGSVRNGFMNGLIQNGGRPRAEKYMVGPFGGSGFGTDVNGIASLPGDPGEADDSFYPFTSVDGRTLFDAQTTGDHVFSLYEGRGVAHYGLYADAIADMMKNSDASQEEIDEAVGQLFTSAEAYLRMWERAYQGRDIP